MQTDFRSASRASGCLRPTCPRCLLHQLLHCNTVCVCMCWRHTAAEEGCYQRDDHEGVDPVARSCMRCTPITGITCAMPSPGRPLGLILHHRQPPARRRRLSAFSFHVEPSSKNSFFQMGTVALSSSIAQCTACMVPLQCLHQLWPGCWMQLGWRNHAATKQSDCGQSAFGEVGWSGGRVGGGKGRPVRLLLHDTHETDMDLSGVDGGQAPAIIGCLGS